MEREAEREQHAPAVTMWYEVSYIDITGYTVT